MTDETGSIHNVRKYTGATKLHPLMIGALPACDDRAFAESLCDYIDECVKAGAKGADIVDALRIISGTLCDMQWMLKD
jgi:hypothetical protein